MNFEIKELPKSLDSLTLQQWVEWDKTYGKELGNKFKDAESLDDEHYMLLQYDLYKKYYCFYTNTQLSDMEILLKEKPNFIVEIMKISSESQMLIFREMSELQYFDEINNEFTFENKTWIIAPPFAVKNPESLTIQEFEQSQDIALIFSDLQDGDTNALYELCGAYLRPKQGGESFATMPKDFKVNLMKTLPLRIGLCVKKYIEETISVYSLLGKKNVN